MKKELLDNVNNVPFKELLELCRKHFGEPRINLQRDGKMAKPYQVRQVKKALEKLEKDHGA